MSGVLGIPARVTLKHMSIVKYRLGWENDFFTLEAIDDQTNLAEGLMILIAGFEGAQLAPVGDLVPCFDEAELSERNLSVKAVLDQQHKEGV